MTDLYMLSVLFFIIILAVIVIRDRKSFTREQKIFLLRKTKRGRGFLKRLTNRFPRFWRVLGDIGIVVSLGSSIYGVFMLLHLLTKSFFTTTSVGGLAFLLPTPTADPVIVPGVLGVPFWYWIISIALLVFVHEGAHGIMAVVGKVRIKSLGWGILAVLPLAFVEPDERQLSRKGKLTQLRVFAAGSFANFILAGVSILLLGLMTSMIFVPSGVSFSGVFVNYTAEQNNLSGVIVGINDQEISDIGDLSLALEEAGPGNEIWVTTFNGTDRNVYKLKTSKTPDDGYSMDFDTLVGITFEHYIPGSYDVFEAFGNYASSLFGMEQAESWRSISYEIEKWEYIGDNYPALRSKAGSRINGLEAKLPEYSEPGFLGIANTANDLETAAGLKPFEGPLMFLVGLLSFLFLINLGVGIANMLPLKPLDGGRVWEIIFRRISKRHYKRMTYYLGWFTLLLIIGSFIIPWINF